MTWRAKLFVLTALPLSGYQRYPDKCIPSLLVLLYLFPVVQISSISLLIYLLHAVWDAAPSTLPLPVCGCREHQMLNDFFIKCMYQAKRLCLGIFIRHDLVWQACTVEVSQVACVDCSAASENERLTPMPETCTTEKRYMGRLHRLSCTFGLSSGKDNRLAAQELLQRTLF